MRSLRIGNKLLTNKDVFVIAEIGSNHMGDVELCEKMIMEAARCGADAVKLQKRNNSVMFTKTALGKPYDNELSYGKTYGEHRNHLDWFGGIEFERFKRMAEDHGILFFATPFEEESALFLNALKVPMFKIASCDVNNHPFIRFVAAMQKPMIISTGGHTPVEIHRMKSELDGINPNYALLHCVSLYPNEDKDLHLREITALRNYYQDKLIGFSSHHPGIEPLIIARTLGASIFEVHFTLNRGARGTDHGFSMEPNGLRKICEDLPRVDTMLGDDEARDYDKEKQGFISKMGKSVYVSHTMKAGTVIQWEDIAIKSPAGGMQPYQASGLIGKELAVDCSTGEAFKQEWVK
jgi:N-acetylneuraminate synthase/sialic acid synthase